MELLAIRHGSVEPIYRGRFLSSTDPPLSEEGRAEVVGLSAALSAVAPMKVCASPLSRALETASILNRSWQSAVEVHPLLRELDMGEMEGVAACDLPRLAPDLHRQWRADMGRARFPGGESMTDVLARVVPWLDHFRQDVDGTIVLVTHLYVILALVHRFAGVPFDHLRKVQIDTSSVTHWTLGKSSSEDRLKFLNWRPQPYRPSVSPA